MKARNIRSKLTKAVAMVPAVITAGMFNAQTVFCGGADFLTSHTVSVTPESVDGTSVMNNILTILCGAVVLFGLFTVVTGVMTYFTAKGEQNTADEAKAVKKIVMGIVEIFCPALIVFIFS